MSGFLTLFIAVLSILTLGLLVFMMGQGSYAELPADVGPESAQIINEKVMLQVKPTNGAEEECTDDNVSSVPLPEAQAAEADNGERVGSRETLETSESQIFISLELPDMASLKIAGTGEVCTQ